MIEPATLDKRMAASLKLHFKSTASALDNERRSYWSHWSQLADNFLPRRYKWFLTPNQQNRGSQVNSSIVDETGLLAARTCASGMMSGLTSPTRPWFRLGLRGLESIEYGPVKNWLAEVERRMMKVMGESNLYQSLAILYHDLTVFGSAGAVIYEDPEEVIRCFNPALGEFYFLVGPRLDVNGLYRKFTYTIDQTVQQFGFEHCSPETQQAWTEGGAARQREVIIWHAIEANTKLFENESTPLTYAVPPSFKYREVYWEESRGDDSVFLSLAGYNEKCFVGARWDVTSNDAYGRSPGMDGLPAVRQLQIQQRRKAEAIDKMVRPPMNASVNMRNEPTSILPGAVNFVADLQGAGFKPAYIVDPRLAEMLEDIKGTQDRVREIFFVDLFMMISQLDTVRTATEIDARREEKLIQLGPVIERFENEVLDPMIDRIFSIMARRGLLPPAPPEIAGREINVQYISMLAEAQRAASTAGIERLLQLVGGMAAIAPQALDKIKVDDLIDEYADLLSVSPKIIASIKEVAALRAAKAQQEQALQAAQMAQMTAEGAKTLSQTNVGGGQNALEAMMS